MASSSKAWRALEVALRLVLGGIFIYAAWSKLHDPWQLFAMNIDSYQVLPLHAVTVVARVLPWLELLVGLLLLPGFWLRTSSSVVSLLLLTFFVLMVRAYAKGMEINCGCFGTGEPISWKTLLRDGSLLAGALTLLCMSFWKRRKAA